MSKHTRPCCGALTNDRHEPGCPKLKEDGVSWNLHKLATWDDMLAALEEIGIIRCETCDGSGFDPHGPGPEYAERDACRGCGGFGCVIVYGDPHAIRKAIAAARGEVDNG